MKRRCLLVVAVAMLSLLAAQAPAAHADSEPQRRSVTWTVQVDPLTTALGLAHVLFERRVSSHVAVYLGPSFRLYDSPLIPDDEEGHRAFGFEAGARWFFAGTAPRGWWAGVRGVAARISFAGRSRIGGYGSILAGHAWVLDHRWVLSAALGVSYFDYAIADVGTTGLLPAAHTGVGIVF